MVTYNQQGDLHCAKCHEFVWMCKCNDNDKSISETIENNKKKRGEK